MLNILVPLDGSDFAESAISHAIAIARSFDGSVTLLSVVTPTEFRAEDAFRQVDWRLRKHQASTYLEGIAAKFESDGVSCDFRVDEGRPAEVILRTARDLCIQLLVLSTHGRGGAFDFPRGSVASKILSSFDASVLLVGPDAGTTRDRGRTYRKILVPIDGSFQSECSMRVAAMLADAQNATLTVACIVQPPELPFVVRHNSRAVTLCRELADITRSAVERRLSELRAQLPAGVVLHTAIVSTDGTGDAIVEAVHRYDSDLLVLSENLSDGAVEFKSAAKRDGDFVAPLPILVLGSQGVAEAFCVQAAGQSADDVVANDLS